MEMVKSLIKQYYSLLIMFGCVSFVIWVFFSEGRLGKENVFEGAGDVFAPVLDMNEIKNDGFSYVEGLVSDYVPIMTYTGGVQTVGSYMKLKNMFDVTLEDGTMVNGSTEDGFSIYLMDIKNVVGDSVLFFGAADDIADIEEIPAPFVYEKEQDILCCFQSGVYTVYVKIYGTNGGEKTYSFHLPVESS